MSLINKVLDDLEKQKKAKPVQQEEVLSGLEVVSTNKPKNRKVKIIFLITILVILAIILIYKFTPARRNIKATVQKVEIQVKKAIPQKTTATDETQTVKTPVHTMAKEESMGNVKQLIINMENNEATLNFVLDQEAHYQIEHSNDKQKFSIELTNIQLDNNMQPVNLNNAPVKSLDFQQQHKNLMINMILMPNTEIKKINMIEDGSKHLLKIVLFNSSLQTFVEAKVHKSEVPLSIESQVDQKYQSVVELISNGRTDEAVKELYSILSDLPSYLPARVTLVKILIQNNQLHEANRILNQGLMQSVNYVPFIKLKAHILVRQGNVAKALNVLEEAAPSIKEDPDYYAFVAALYQQKGQYLVAARLYDQLVKIKPERGMWWAGLGIALESAGKKNAAVEAYQRAMQGEDMSPQMRAYVESRMGI